MMTMIRNVVFDLGGVLVGLDIERCRAAFRSLGMDAVARVIDPCYPAEMIGRLESGQITFHEACDEMRDLCKRPDITDEQIAWAYGEFLTGVAPEKIEMLETLRRRGIRTYVLSNNNPASMRCIRAMFAAGGRSMDECFDHIYLSYQMRLLKPSEAIFRSMIDHSGMKPEETLFIDDGARNVEAARALGFSVYMPSPEDDFLPLLDTIGK